MPKDPNNEVRPPHDTINGEEDESWTNMQYERAFRQDLLASYIKLIIALPCFNIFPLGTATLANQLWIVIVIWSVWTIGSVFMIWGTCSSAPAIGIDEPDERPTPLRAIILIVLQFALTGAGVAFWVTVE